MLPCRFRPIPMLLDIGFLWPGRDYGRAGNYFRRSLASARTIDDPLAVAQSLNRLGNWYVNIQPPEQPFEHHEEALDHRQALAPSLAVRHATASKTSP